MKQLIKRSLDILFKNWPTLLAFDMVYKMFSYSILYSITTEFLTLILKTSGISYLSAENLHLVLLRPIPMLLLLGIIFLTALSVFFETVALYVYCEAGWQQKRISIVQLVKQTLFHCKKLFHLQNLLLFLGFIMTTILTVLPFSPFMLQWLRIPEFIMDFIKQDRLLFFAFCIVAILANLVCFLFLFFLPGTLFQDQTMRAGWKNGIALLKKRKLITLLRVLGAYVFIGIVMFMLIAAVIFALVCYIKLAETPTNAPDIFTIYYYRGVPVIVFLINFLSTIWLFSVLITLFHRYREDSRPLAEPPKKTGKLYRVKQIALIVCAVIAVLLFSESELGGSFMNRPYSDPQIVAHRSGDILTPENTMAALDHVISMDVDMVEIDVQQLSDGTLILMHDSSFHRTAGKKKKVWEVTYEEVRKYDAGSWFSQDFAGEPIPKLEDFLKRSKGNVHVMIELKLTGHEEKLVEEVIALVEKYDMLDQCNIASLNLDLLKEVKAINPKVETVYITPLIFSSQYDIDFVDGFSVETTVLTREMVTSMHMQGKDVYGWTANSEETIEKNLRCEVDGIVTDNAELVKSHSIQTWDNLLLDTLLEIFFDGAKKQVN